MLMLMCITTAFSIDFTFQITSPSPSDQFRVTASDLDVTIFATSTVLTTLDPAGISVEYLATSTAASKTFTISESGHSNTLVKGQTSTVLFGELPAEIVDFTAKRVGNYIIIDLATASETDNAGFELQHSQDAKEWQVLTFIEGHGTTSEPQSYTYKHESPKPGMNYYRLKQIDIGGENWEYSSIISIGIEQLVPIVKVYPNPTPHVVNIENAQYGTIEIYNILGQKVKSVPILGVNQVIDMESMNRGQYIAKVTYNGEIVSTHQIIKL